MILNISILIRMKKIVLFKIFIDLFIDNNFNDSSNLSKDERRDGSSVVDPFRSSCE